MALRRQPSEQNYIRQFRAEPRQQQVPKVFQQPEMKYNYAIWVYHNQQNHRLSMVKHPISLYAEIHPV